MHPADRSPAPKNGGSEWMEDGPEKSDEHFHSGLTMSRVVITPHVHDDFSEVYPTSYWPERWWF